MPYYEHTDSYCYETIKEEGKKIRYKYGFRDNMSHCLSPIEQEQMFEELKQMVCDMRTHELREQGITATVLKVALQKVHHPAQYYIHIEDRNSQLLYELMHQKCTGFDNRWEPIK